MSIDPTAAPKYSASELIELSDQNWEALGNKKTHFIADPIKIRENALAKFDLEKVPLMQKVFFTKRHKNPTIDMEMWQKDATMPVFTSQQALAYGVATSDTAYRKQILTNLVYHRASLISVGVNIVPVMGSPTLDLKDQFPGELVMEFPLPEGSLPDAQRLTWADAKTVLLKAAMRIPITDESYFRGGTTQFSASIRRASEALAAVKDKEILAKLYSGYQSGMQTDTDGNQWDDENNGNIISDLSTGISNILAYSNITIPELRNLDLTVPAILYGTFLTPRLIEGIQTNLFTYLKTGLGITVWPTRDTTTINIIGGEDRAILTPYSVDTAVHYVYSKDPSPVEVERIAGVQNIYNMRQYFRSRITPFTQDAVKNYRIYTYLDVTQNGVS